jgi:hypothetical protein
VKTFVKATMDQFWAAADIVFNPPDTQNDAAIKLDKLVQGQSSAEEYFIQFDLLAGIAGYSDTTFDTLKIRMASQHLNRALVDNIHNTTDVPTNWSDWKIRATKLDRNYRAGRAIKASRPAAAQNFAPRQQAPSLHSGQRQPTRDPYAMDVDVTRIAAANLTPSPRPKITFELDADGRVIGG